MKRKALFPSIVLGVLLLALLFVPVAGQVASMAESASDSDRLAELEEAFNRADAAFAANPSPESKAARRVAASAVLEEMEARYQEYDLEAALDEQEAGATSDPEVRFDHGGMWTLEDGSSVPDDDLPETQLLWNLNGRKWGAGTSFPGGNFVPGPRIPGGVVTYSFMGNGIAMDQGTSTAISNLPGFQPCFIDEIHNALKLWEAVADIQFVEVADNGVAQNAAGAVGDIRIAAHPFDGVGGTLAHAYYPPPNGVSNAGDAHFDVADTWTCDHRVQGAFDIGVTAAHEFGHSIGLGHETTVNAIMEPFYFPTIDDQNRFFAANLAIPRLHQDDVSGSQEIYSEATADVAIEKTSSANPVMAGEELIYQITVTNNGNGDQVFDQNALFDGNPASGVTVVDDLPLGLVFLDVTAGGFNLASCTLSAGTGPNLEDQLTCLLDDIAPGASRTFEIKMLVPANFVSADPNGTRVVENRAVVDIYQLDPDQSNNIANERTFVEALADLRVFKDCKPDDMMLVGDEAICKISVENLGPSDATGVSFVDRYQSDGPFHFNPVPAGCTVYPVVGENAANVDCDRVNPLPVGITWETFIPVVGDAAENINDHVTGSSDTPDPDESNNWDEDEVNVGPIADLRVEKTVSAGPYYAGNNLTYTVVATNDGPSTATNVVLEDLLPAGVTVVSASSSVGGCTTGIPGDPDAPLTCGLADMLTGRSDTVTVVVKVDPGYAPGPLENDALVYSDVYDPNNSNNRDYTITQVNDRANLNLDKTAMPPVPWIAGEIRTYRYNITNAGPSVSRDVRLRDFLPDEVEFVSAYSFKEGSTGGTPLPCHMSANNVLICPLGDIPPTGAPGPVVVLIDVRINSDVPDGTVITNNADLLTETPDPGGASDSVTQTVFAQADLEIEKTSEPQKVYAGEQKKYTIKVTNLGPSMAMSVTVTDTLPLSVTYEIDTAGCVPYLNNFINSGPHGETYRCELGDMMPGEMREFSIWALVDPAAEPGKTLVNRACVYEELRRRVRDGEDESNNRVHMEVCDTAENLVLGKADLRITKFGKPDGEVRTGDVLTYTVIVDNHGPGNAWGVALKDVLQSNGTFDLIDIVSDRDASCTLLLPEIGQVGPFDLTADPWPPDDAVPVPPGVNPPTGVAGIQERLEVDCTLDEDLAVLAADGPPNSGRWILTLRVRAYQTQDMNNVADVVADTFDPNEENNHAEVLHEITDVANLEVTKEARGRVMQQGGAVVWLDDAVTAGLYLEYTVTVRNNGPARAENVVVEDTLPPGIVVTEVVADQGTCTTGESGEHLNPLICELGTLNDGDEVVVMIFADVLPSVPCDTLLENDVLVYSDMFDADMSDNRDYNITEVSAWADVWVDKDQEPEIVLGGKDIYYKILVGNEGPSDSGSVMVHDIFPPELHNVTWQCTALGDAMCPNGESEQWGDGDIIQTVQLAVESKLMFEVWATRWPVPDWEFTNDVAAMTSGMKGTGCVQDPNEANNFDDVSNEPHMHFLPVIYRYRNVPDGPDLRVRWASAGSCNFEVMIENRGPGAVTDLFEIDMYLNPSRAPRAYEIYNEVGEWGAVWVVDGDALPIPAGGTLLVDKFSPYFEASLGNWDWLAPALQSGQMWAQVDSFGYNDWGQVLEGHEVVGGYYNNIFGPHAFGRGKCE